MDSQSDNNKNINNNSVNTGSHKLGDKLSSSSKLYKYIITIDLCINYLFYVSINCEIIYDLNAITFHFCTFFLFIS